MKQIYSICELCGKSKPNTDHKRCKKCSSIKHLDSHDSFYHSWQQLKRHHNISPDYQRLKSSLYTDYKSGKELHYHNGTIYLMNKSDTSRLMNRHSKRDLPQGVYYSKQKHWYYWQLNINGKAHTKSNFDTAEAAASDRDSYIQLNNIVARLSSGIEFIPESIRRYKLLPEELKGHIGEI